MFDPLSNESHKYRIKLHFQGEESWILTKILLFFIKDNKVIPNKTEIVEIQELAENINLMCLFQKEE